MGDKKSILSVRIKKLRTELGLTQEELALKLGLKGKSSIANYESNKITPSDEVKYKMCEVFDCTMDYLMGKSEFKNQENALNEYLRQHNFYMCPVYGQIVAGQPNWSKECIEGRIPIDTNMMNILNPEEYFFLRVNR